MSKKSKIKIKLNGKFLSINSNYTAINLIEKIGVPLNKVAIEINKKIIDKKKLKNTKLKKRDSVEIVHFIGGG